MADQENPPQGPPAPPQTPPPAAAGGDNNERNININIEDEMKSSYMDYAMSVIVGRAPFPTSATASNPFTAASFSA
jgi:hypothetical protein